MPPKKIVLPGFTPSQLANRAIPAADRLNEAIEVAGCAGQLFLLHFGPGDVRPTHTHAEVRVTFVRSGRMKLTYEGQAKEFGSGDMITTQPGLPHSLEVLGTEPLCLAELVLPVPCSGPA